MITLSMMMRFIVSMTIIIMCPVVLREVVGHPEGTLVGLILGLVLGLGAWRILTMLDGQSMIRAAKKEFGDKSAEELRELLQKGNTMTPNLILMALMLRGENIERDIFPVLKYLESDIGQRRNFGYAALRTGYPYLTQFIDDYSPANPLDVCRTQVGELRSWVEEQLQKAQEIDA